MSARRSPTICRRFRSRILRDGPSGSAPAAGRRSRPRKCPSHCRMERRSRRRTSSSRLPPRRAARPPAGASHSRSSSCGRSRRLQAPYRFPTRCAATSRATTLRGTLRNGAIEWTGNAEAPEHYSVNVEFRNLGLAAQDALPGATNLSGSIAATEAKGELRLASRAVSLSLPKLFAEPLALDTARGDITWQRRADATQMQMTDIAFANADVAGTAAGTWHSRPVGPGDIDLKAQLTHANLAMAHRYVPVAASPAVRDWLRKALQKGTSNDAKMTLTGDLAQFPFAQGKGGQFVLTVKGQDATLAYAENWPPITNIARRCARRRRTSRDQCGRRPGAGCADRRDPRRDCGRPRCATAAPDRWIGERTDQRIPDVHFAEPGRPLDRPHHRRRHGNRRWTPRAQVRAPVARSVRDDGRR